ncbi:prephenate dehydratase domain-containing protein, partial [Arthrospira platensis SPKY1]|nr:prephenate dehydratase domain-containing protein [Arthrospira platensis SPKY1]
DALPIWRSVQAQAHAGVNDVIRDVEAGIAQFGLLPVETSREGTLGPTLDIFFRSRLRICGEVQVRTHHHLLGTDGSSLDQIERVYGLPWVFSACRLWLDEH